MPLGDRIRRRRHRDGPRLVRSGEGFTSDELERGDVELELPDPTPEIPVSEQAEPWGWGSKDMPARVAGALAEYRRLFPEDPDGERERR